MYKTTRQFALFPIFSTDMHLYDTDYSLSLMWLEKKTIPMEAKYMNIYNGLCFYRNEWKKLFWIILPEVHRIFIMDYAFIKTNAKKILRIFLPEVHSVKSSYLWTKSLYFCLIIGIIIIHLRNWLFRYFFPLINYCHISFIDIPVCYFILITIGIIHVNEGKYHEPINVQYKNKDKGFTWYRHFVVIIGNNRLHCIRT